jgi:hypothetical protein
MYASQNIGCTPVSKHVDLSMEIISEFVFCEVDRRGSRKRVSRLMRKQFYSILTEYFYLFSIHVYHSAIKLVIICVLLMLTKFNTEVTN